MRQSRELNDLDERIASLSDNDSGSRSAGSCRLILEHLRAARTALLGAMHSEYGLSLEQAMESISCIADITDRLKTKNILRSLIDLNARSAVLRVTI